MISGYLQLNQSTNIPKKRSLRVRINKIPLFRGYKPSLENADN